MPRVKPQGGGPVHKHLALAYALLLIWLQLPIRRVRVPFSFCNLLLLCSCGRGYVRYRWKTLHMPRALCQQSSRLLAQNLSRSEVSAGETIHKSASDWKAASLAAFHGVGLIADCLHQITKDHSAGIVTKAYMPGHHPCHTAWSSRSESTANRD